MTEQDLWDWIEGKGVIPGHGRNFSRAYPKEYEELRKEINKRLK